MKASNANAAESFPASFFKQADYMRIRTTFGAKGEMFTPDSAGDTSIHLRLWKWNERNPALHFLQKLNFLKHAKGAQMRIFGEVKIIIIQMG